MRMLGHFYCENRKPDSLDCKGDLECPRASGGECDSFDPDGETILDNIVETWLHKAQKGDGLTDGMTERLRNAIVIARGSKNEV